MINIIIMFLYFNGGAVISREKRFDNWVNLNKCSVWKGRWVEFGKAYKYQSQMKEREKMNAWEYGKIERVSECVLEEREQNNSRK